MRPISRKYDEAEHQLPSEWVDFWWNEGRKGAPIKADQGNDGMITVCVQAEEIWQKPLGPLAERVKAQIGEMPVYITYDIDSLDPAYAPGTGTPVWGGLTSAQAAIILRDLAGINMVGGDIVEVSPPYDTTGATAIAGAHVAYDLIALFAWAKARRG